MSRIACFGALALSLTAFPAIARPVAPAITTVTVTMADRGFHPQVIRLRGGQTYRLRLLNSDRTAHDFFAPGFFYAARIAPREAAKLDKDRLDVRSGEARSIVLTPRVGHYDLKSTKALDVVANMTGQILVY